MELPPWPHAGDDGPEGIAVIGFAGRNGITILTFQEA
jgi:hypothetical protein